MDTLLHDFISTCKEQDKWEKEYTAKDPSDRAVFKQWKKLPLKLIPEFDCDIMHRRTDKHCKSRCTPQSSEEELGDGFCDYLCDSEIEIEEQSDGDRGDFAIHLATFH